MTIAGAPSVMLHDSRFRFELNLATAPARGSVCLVDHIAGRKVSCKLRVVDTGKTADGNPTCDYAGSASLRMGG